MNFSEMLRRDVIRLIGLGGSSLLLMPGAALAQNKTTFRMDEQNSIHFLAGTFIPKYLTKPIKVDELMNSLKKTRTLWAASPVNRTLAKAKLYTALPAESFWCNSSAELSSSEDRELKGLPAGLALSLVLSSLIRAAIYEMGSPVHRVVELGSGAAPLRSAGVV